MKQFLCIGTYTEPILFGTGEVFQGKGEGAYICAFDGEGIEIVSSIPLRNPSFLCIDEDRRRIYTVNEMKEYMDQFGGGVTELSYDVDAAMTQLSTFVTAGTDPCHIVVSPDQRLLVISNFASGAVTTFPLDAEGGIDGEGRRVYRHEGHSVHPKRQQGPHAHSAIFTPDGERMFVPDLGIDRVVAYAVGAGELIPDPRGSASVTPGSGPRYGEFSPDGKHFYLINEIGSSITHFTYAGGELTPLGNVSTLPEDFTGENICSDLHVSADGMFLYASNRGHDSIVTYAIGANGALALIDRVSCGGRTPRNFTLDPSGRFVLVGNQDSDSIAIFAIGADGRLSHRCTVPFPTPVCLRFFQHTKF